MPQRVKLHQVLAIERGTEVETARRLALATAGMTVTGEQSPLSGLSRTYEPRDDNPNNHYPGADQRVQLRVEQDILPAIREAFGRLLDVKLTREAGNAEATADLKVGDRVILRAVPATYLLLLESKLAELKQLLLTLPVLDPAEDWTWDRNRGTHVSKVHRKAKTIPVPKVQELSPAKIEGGVGLPAQVRAYEIHEPIGDWAETKFSGCMPAELKEEMVGRLTQLIEAAKFAREDANRLDVEFKEAGDPIFDFIVGSGVASRPSTASS